MELKTNLKKEFKINEVLEIVGEISKEMHSKGIGKFFSFSSILNDLYGNDYVVNQEPNLGRFSDIFSCCLKLKSVKSNSVLTNNMKMDRMSSYYQELLGFALETEKSRFKRYLISFRNGKLISCVSESHRPSTVSLNILDDIYLVTVSELLKSIKVNVYNSLNNLNLATLKPFNLSNNAIEFLLKNYCYNSVIREINSEELKKFELLSSIEEEVFYRDVKAFVKTKKVFESNNEIIFIQSRLENFYHEEYSSVDRTFVFKKNNDLNTEIFNLKDFYKNNLNNFEISFNNENFS